MRKTLLAGAVGWLALSGAARAQQASMFTGSYTNTQMQYQTIVDKSPLVAPIPNQAQAPPLYARVLNRLFGLLQPTIGSNPVASVSTAPSLSSPVSGSTFQPSAPFYNPQ